MHIKEITLDEFSEFFKINPDLAYMGLSDQSLDYLYHTDKVLVPAGAKLIGIYEEDMLITCIELDYWSSICGNLHMYVPICLQRTGISKIFKIELYKYILNNTDYKKLLFNIPGACKHVIRAAESIGLKYEGTIKECYVWRNNIVDIVIYSLNLCENLNGNTD